MLDSKMIFWYFW